MPHPAGPIADTCLHMDLPSGLTWHAQMRNTRTAIRPEHAPETVQQPSDLSAADVAGSSLQHTLQHALVELREMSAEMGAGLDTRGADGGASEYGTTTRAHVRWGSCQLRA